LCYVDPQGYFHVPAWLTIYKHPFAEDEYKDVELVIDSNLVIRAVYESERKFSPDIFVGYRTMEKQYLPLNEPPYGIVVNKLSLNEDRRLIKVSWDTLYTGDFKVEEIVEIDETGNIYAKASKKGGLYCLKMSPEGRILGVLPLEKGREIKISKGLLYTSYVEDEKFYVLKYPKWLKIEDLD
jgi:hypothetical protein